MGGGIEGENTERECWKGGAFGCKAKNWCQGISQESTRKTQVRFLAVADK